MTQTIRSPDLNTSRKNVQIEENAYDIGQSDEDASKVDVGGVPDSNDMDSKRVSINADSKD